MIRSGHIAVVVAIGYGIGIIPQIVWSVAAVMAVILLIQRCSGRSPSDEDNKIHNVRIVR